MRFVTDPEGSGGDRTLLVVSEVLALRHPAATLAAADRCSAYVEQPAPKQTDLMTGRVSGNDRDVPMLRAVCGLSAGVSVVRAGNALDVNGAKLEIRYRHASCTTPRFATAPAAHRTLRAPWSTCA